MLGEPTHDHAIATLEKTFLGLQNATTTNPTTNKRTDASDTTKKNRRKTPPWEVTMSLRIESSSGSNGSPRRGPGGEPVDEDFYMSRLVKLIPGEAIAVYPLVHSQASQVANQLATAPPTSLRKTVDAAPTSDFVAPETTIDIVQTAATSPPFYDASWLPIAVTWGVLIMVIALRWQATRGPNGDAQWGAVAIAAISFFLLAHTMGGTFGVLEFANSREWIAWPQEIRDFVPQLLLTFWTILMPAFYKPQN